MKIKLEENYKSIYTLENLYRAKRIIEEEKEDAETAAGYARIAADHIAKKHVDWVDRIIEASAETALNNRVWNVWNDSSGNMDIWIRFIAKTWCGFIEGGAYLSDIHGITGDNDLTGHMYYTLYKKA